MSESLDQKQADAIKNTIDAVRESVMTRIADANKIAETEVIQIGGLLTEIVDIATSDKADVSESLDMLSGDRESTVTRGIQKQAETVTGFIEDVCTRLGSQKADADKAMALCADISNAVTAIETVTRKSHLLAWNISIEAARLGAQGKAVATIGSSMGDFTTEISEATKRIVELLERLTDSLPALSQSSTTLSETAAEFSTDLGTSLAEIEGNVDELSDRLRQGVAEAEERNGTVLRLSQETLSHLAFQDPVAQQLLRGENDLLEMSSLIGDIIDCRIDSSVQEYATFCGNDNDNDEQEAGYVDLF